MKCDSVQLRYLRAAVHSGLHGGQRVVGLGRFADVGVEFGAGHVVPPARLQQETQTRKKNPLKNSCIMRIVISITVSI